MELKFKRLSITDYQCKIKSTTLCMDFIIFVQIAILPSLSMAGRDVKKVISLGMHNLVHLTPSHSQASICYLSVKYTPSVVTVSCCTVMSCY